MSRYTWLGWAVPVAFVAFLSLREIGTADFWWQWAAGRHILEHGIPTVDPWLTTAEPRPWIELRWLFCIALYASVENVGAWLPIICAAVLYSCGLGFVLICNKGAAWTWRMSAGVLAVIAVGRRLTVRPEVFTFAFLGMMLFLIVRVRQKQLSKKWALVWIAVIQVAWVNTHALFAIGPALCGLWLIVELIEKGKARGVAFGALVLTLACSLLNPYGFAGLLYPITLLGELHGGAYRGNIIELKAPFALGMSPSLVAHLVLAAVVLYCAIKKRGDSLLLCFAAVTFYLSMIAVRNVPLFALASLAFLVSCRLDDSKFSRGLSLAAGIGAISFAYMFAVGTWSIEDRVGLSIDRSRYGLDTAEALTKEDSIEPIFNTLVEGGLLAAVGRRAYCDPRLEVLPQERFLEMMAISRLKMPLPERYRSVLLVVDCPLAASLVKQGGWRIVGMDRVAIALVREEGATVDIAKLERMALDALPQNPPAFSWFRKSLSPIPYRRMATFFSNLGKSQIAGRFRDEARRIYPVP